jgi:cell division septum initiation protein DivIVA
VFLPTYRLRPLSEVEAYIQQHHHLPEIPSADEIEKNGLDLGENQKAVIAKIEELTLYILQLNKKIEALEKDLAQKNNRP